MTTATLTELQTERARLKALDARRELDEATAQTRRADDLLRAALAVRAVLMDELRALPTRLAEAIDGEHDETRVHYLLSDAVHTLLDGIGRRAEAASSALPEFGARFRRGSRPRALMTVSQWADKHRWLVAGTNAPGKWRTDLTPYLRDIQDDLSEHSPVRTVVFMKSSGVGGTEAMFNWIGYLMAHLGNRDLLVVMPSARTARPLVQPAPGQDDRRIAGARRPGEHAPGATAPTAATCSNTAPTPGHHQGRRQFSADSLRSDHLPYVICDEVDAYKWDVGGEGDPMTLIENRQRTYTRAKTFLVSTPTSRRRVAHRPAYAQRHAPVLRAVPALRRIPAARIRRQSAPYRTQDSDARPRKKPRKARNRSSPPGTSANPASAPRSSRKPEKTTCSPAAAGSPSGRAQAGARLPHQCAVCSDRPRPVGWRQGRAEVDRRAGRHRPS
jgi:hypothetical protein